MFANHIVINLPTIFGFMLILGVIGGHAAHVTRFFPRITGYILIGLIFGPNMLGLLSNSLLADARIFSDIAIGLVLFQLGLQINIKNLYQNRSLLLTGVIESLVTFTLIFITLRYFHIGFLHAALAATIGASSSPALTLIMANKEGDIGLVTQRSLTLVAINNIIAFCGCMILLPMVNFSTKSFSGALYAVIVEPVYRMIGPVILASVLGFVMLMLGRMIGRRESAQFSLLVGILIMTIGLAQMFDLSPIIAPLVLGVVITNFDKRDHLLEIELGYSGEIFFIILFVLTGAKLHIGSLISVGWIAAAFVLARLVGKFVPVFLLSRHHGLSHTQSYALALTLLPMAGMAIGLVNTTIDVSSSFAELLSAIILASVAIIEVITPLITMFALKKAGELTEATMPAH